MEKQDKTISFDYPQINFDSKEIIELNSKSNNTYKKIEKGYNLLGDDSCICIKIGEQYHCGGEHLENMEYRLLETNKLDS